MRLAVDHHATHSTNPLPAIMIEGNRILALTDQTLVENVEHLEKRHLVRDVVHLIGLKASRRIGIRLPPNLEGDVHL
jgi:hypothetical protein